MTDLPLQPEQLILGRYTVIAIAGYGSAGPVMRAHDTRLHRDVAINTLPRPTDFTDNDAYALAAQRLRQRAAVGARLPAHPNLVSIYDFTEGQDGALYLIREYITGGTLTDRLRTGPLSVVEAVTVTSEAAAGLQIAHDCGVVHRDIKPDNIFLDADGHALVSDFGIAQIDDLSKRTNAEYSHPGTPLYMSPEQSRSGYVTPASDQYSLGLVFFEMLTGKRYKPLGKRGVANLLAQMPSPLAALITRMTAENPDDRFADMQEVIASLHAGTHHVSTAATPFPTTASAGTAVSSPQAANASSSSPPQPASPAAPVEAALRLGRYRVVRVIAKDRFSTTMQAYDTALQRDVMLKETTVDRENPEALRSIQERFRFAAYAGVRVFPHPHVIGTYDHITDPMTQTQILALEYVPDTVRERLKGGPLPLPEALGIVAGVARGLQALHDAGIVHRNVKPTNIYLTSTEVAKIGDLTLVQVRDVADREEFYGAHPGTPLYMSPEHHLPGVLRPASDQYGLGLVIFEMLTGEHYRRTSPARVRALLAPFPTHVQALITRMTQESPDDRYPDLTAVTAAIEAPAAIRSGSGRGEMLLLNRYRVVGEVGAGTFGKVVRAEDQNLPRTVAMKQLKPEHAADQELQERFTQEASVGARLRPHSNLVALYDSAVAPDGARYLILEFVGGGTLARRIAQGPLPVHEALRLIADVARGLNQVHLARVVHRDIKPENIFLTEDGTAKVGDFGIAQIEGYSRRSSIQPRFHPGTILYMSPEQSQTLDYLRSSSDQYSVGLVLFEMITGLAYKRLSRKATTNHLAAMPPPVAALIEQMLAEDPNDRYETMDAVATASLAIVTSLPPPSAGNVAGAGAVGASGTTPMPSPRSEPPGAPTHPGAQRPDTTTHTVLAHGDAAIHAVAFSSDGSLVAAGDDAHRVRVWPVAVSNLARTLSGHTGRVSAVAFSPDGGIIASASFDTTARLWRVADGTPISILRGHAGPVHALAFAPGGQLLVTVAEDGTARVWDAASGYCVRVVKAHPAPVYAVAFSPSGTLIATGAADACIHLWRAQDGAPDRTFRGHTGPVTALTFHPGGEMLYSGSEDFSVRYWHIRDARATATLTAVNAVTYGVAAAPDGLFIASADSDTSIRLQRASDGTPIRALKGHTAAVRAVAFSPDGHSLASVSLDGTVRLWPLP